MSVHIVAVKDLQSHIHSLEEQIQAWANNVITKDRILSTLLILAVVLIYGLILVIFDQTLSNNTIIGTAPY